MTKTERIRTGAVMVALVGASAWLRTRNFDVGFWIDEALSVGIADRPVGDIPGVLRLDGSPPLYYVLLNVWMSMTGDRGEEATHALSLLFALATIPVAWWLARELFGERAGWIAAVLAALNPFLTQYAQETRMYALVILLGTVVCATFVGVFAQARGRRWAIALGVSLAMLLYTHNWGLFMGAAAGLTWLWLVARDRRLLPEGLWAFGVTAVLYLPWVPTLLFQAAHTGAPWARAPGLEQLSRVPEHLLGETGQWVLLIAAGSGLVALTRARESRAVALIAALAIGTVAIAWLASQVSPAWATRYLAIAVPPLLLLAAAGLARAGRVGIAGVVALAIIWGAAEPPEVKSNVRFVTRLLDPALVPGDLVVSTQPEQLPALAYYLQTPGLRYATLTGLVSDLGVTDWRDGVERLERTAPARHLAPLLDELPVGRRVAIVEPEIYELERWSAPWTSLVRVRSAAWQAWMRNDGRFRVVAEKPPGPVTPGPNPVRVTVYLKRRIR